MKFVKLGIGLLLILCIILPSQVLAVAKHEKVESIKNNSISKGLHKGQSEIKGLYNKITNGKTEEQQLKDAKKDKLESDIKNYLGNNIDSVGLSYYDITSGGQININPNKVFLAGSTVKVQLNMILGDQFANGQASKNEQLTYKDSDYEDGAGVLQGTDLSKPYDITTLSDYSIIHSDNIATNMIEDRLGYENFRKAVDKKLGQPTDHSGNYITSSDETKLLKQLYENKDENSYYSHIVDIMKKTDFHDRLDKYVDKSIVAHKIGDYSDYVNDVGIIYTDKPYIISVYTKGVTNADEVIAHISKMIYDYQTAQ
jgi:beta-lactamase class A